MRPIHRYRRLARVGAASVLIGLGLLSAINHHVANAAQGRLFTVAEAPARPVAIVFGARAMANGEPSAVLADRVRTAVELYRAGKVQKLLLTGDNSRRKYDEPTVMKRFAVKLGVPERDIALDYAGFRTYDSCYRARAIFGVKSALLVTQQYHLPRALYTARGLGLDADGVIADRHVYNARRRWWLRERLSTAVAWLQVNVTKPQPKYLGQPEPRLVEAR